jgi:hypothetical protein
LPPTAENIGILKTVFAKNIDSPADKPGQTKKG